MLTRTDILELEHYCKEHGVTRTQRLEECGIKRSTYYRNKRQYRNADRQLAENSEVGEFIELPSQPGIMQPSFIPPKETHKNTDVKSPQDGSYLVIEIQTENGVSMRIQGSMTPSHIKELMSSFK